MIRVKKDPRWTGYKNRAAGEFGEGLVKSTLEAVGYAMVEKVATPWKIVRGPGGRIVHAFPVEKVSGDFRAVHPSHGQSVLVEVKTHDGDTLTWSTFEDHQHEALAEHSKAGGQSIMAWVREGKVHLINWPLQGFGPGKSIKFPSLEVAA